MREYMPALIVAFDGVLADTLDARANAIVKACAEEQIDVQISDVRPLMAGRSLDEAVQAVIALRAEAGLQVDQTTADLVALRAQRHYAARLAQGVTLDDTIRREIVQASASGHRVALRADSLRRDVEPLLALSDLEHHITLLRCADDRSTTGSSRDTTLSRSWHAIDARLTAMQIPRSQRRVRESSSQTAVLASAFVDVDAS